MTFRIVDGWIWSWQGISSRMPVTAGIRPLCR